MTVFESTKPCKNSQDSLISKGFEFISKFIPENEFRKRKEHFNRRRPRGQNLAQQKNEPSKPTRGSPFLLTRASTRKQTLTSRPHPNSAHLADKWVVSTPASSPPARPVRPQSTLPFPE